MPTFTQRANGNWLAQVRITGFEPAHETFPTKAEAKAWAERIEAELRAQRKKGSTRKDLPSLTLRTLLLDYLADPETKAQKSFDETHRLCCWWIENCGSEPVLQFGVLKIREGRAKLLETVSQRAPKHGKHKGRKLTPSTVNRYISTGLRSPWNWAIAAGLVPDSHPFPKRILLGEPRGRKRFLTDDEIGRLLQTARDHSSAMHTGIVVSAATGVRQGELLRLNWSDADFARKTISVHLSKNEDPKVVYLDDAPAAALNQLKGAKVRGIGPVFITEDGARLKRSTLYARWKVVRKDAGPERFSLARSAALLRVNPRAERGDAHADRRTTRTSISRLDTALRTSGAGRADPGSRGA